MLFEARYYTTGWSFRFGLLQFRWNRQDNYCSFSIEWIKTSYVNSTGLTWKEFRLLRKEQRDKAIAARQKAEAQKTADQ